MEIKLGDKITTSVKLKRVGKTLEDIEYGQMKERKKHGNRERKN